MVAKKIVDKDDSIGYPSPNKLLDCKPFQPIYHKAHISARNLVDAASSIGNDSFPSLYDDKPCVRAGKQISIKKRLRVKRVECILTMRCFLRAEQSKGCFSVWTALRRALQKQTLV